MIIKDITIDKSLVKEQLGYKEHTESNAQIEDLISSSIRETYTLISPRGNYLMLDKINIDYQNHKVILGQGSIAFSSKDISQLLREQEAVALLSLTIGAEMEEEINRLFGQGEFTKATILDAIASIAAEDAANQLTQEIIKEAQNKGLPYSTIRYSPGYGDLKLEVQEEILDLTAGRELGISTNSSHLLLPQKSITALIGFSSQASKGTTKCKFNCRSCELEKCVYSL